MLDDMLWDCVYYYFTPSGRDGLIDSIKKRKTKTRKQTQPRLVAQDRIRGFVSATRMLYFAFSLRAALVCPLSYRSNYVVYILSIRTLPPLFLVL
jgi:hypothetical protein